ncbi:MAG: glycoside hydrolase family 99-like domain-containing protein, partial [Armatimonadetes bacterium]|nr:glycoside hydrolase family 99-like domain-containing protein [Armatimonadota bacterium]
TKPIKATPTQVIEVRLKSPVEGGAEFFWTNTTEGKYQGFEPGKETQFHVKPGWHVYRVRPFWQGEGQIVKLRFDLPGVKADRGEKPQVFEVDYIRVIELGPAGPPVPANWTFDRDAQGWTVEGEGKLSVEKGWLVARLEKGARLVAPPVEVNGYDDIFVGFVLAVDRGTSGRVIWATGKTNGLHSISFQTIADGKPHVYNVPVSVQGKWQKPVIYLAFEPCSGDSCTARLDWLRTAPEPVGPPELEVRRFLVSDALPRAGRPCELLAQVANRGGGTLEGLKAELLLPEGVRMAKGEARQKTVPALDYYEPQQVTWHVVASRPGEQRFGLRIAGKVSASAETRDNFLPSLHLPKATYVPEPRPVTSDYDVGIYYFPGWWDWQRWQPIMNYPERKPVLGWYREGLPEVADWHIKFAVEHGVKFFCYDWYWDRGRTRLQQALHDGFFHARYRHLLKFCLLWANHSPTVHTPEDNVKVCQYWIDNYFNRPEYYKVNGRPLVVIFSIWAMKRDLGIEGTRKAIELWHKMTREAGVGEIMVAGCGRGGEVLDEMKQMGFDAVTGYNWPSCGVTGRNYVPYIEVARKQFDLWWMPMAEGKVMPVITPTSPGWDSRPWHGQRSFVQVDRTPQAFEEHLRLARKFIDTTGQPKVLLIEAWNEFGEGSYCEPHKEFGFGHLEAVRRVFCPGAPEHQDYGPADVGLGPYDCEPPKLTQTKWEFNTDGDSEGWAPMMGLGDFKVAGGAMHATATSHDPAFTCGVRVRARQFKTVEIRMAVAGAKDGDGCQLFWATSLSATSEPASVKAELITDGKMHTYRLDVGTNRLWRGIITKLRLDPCSTQGAKISVDYVRLLP